MKKIVSMLLCLLLMGVTVQSQNAGRNMLRMRMEQAKLQRIRQNLQLDEATFTRFRPIFIKYERTLANLDFRSQNRLLKVDADSLSAQDADALLLAQWAQAKQLIHIRERFYEDLHEVLTPQQLVKLFQSEAEIRQKAMLELGKRQRKGL
jgi:hypothetical protein